MKGSQADERPFPPRRELFAALQPDAMQAIASAIDILLQRALQTEDAVELFLLQSGVHTFRKAQRSFGA